MKNKGQFRVLKRTQKDYSLTFKLQVVEDIESGGLSQNEAQRKYGIQGKYNPSNPKQAKPYKKYQSSQNVLILC